MLKGFTGIHGAEFAKQEVDRIFALVDTDHSGEIEFSEFVMATVRRDKLLSDEKLMAAFRLFDKDNNGCIDVRELKYHLGQAKRQGDLDVWAGMLRQVDENADGVIDFNEFAAMMRELIK